MTNKYTRQKTV